MLGFGTFLVVVGVLMFVLVYIGALKNGGNLPFRLVALAVTMAGLMLILSSIYLNYTPWFYGFALIKGTVLVALSYYLENKKLLWPGAGLMLAGFLMLIVKPGWFLILLLVGLAVLAYHLYTTDKRTKTTIDSFVKS